VLLHDFSPDAKQAGVDYNVMQRLALRILSITASHSAELIVLEFISIIIVFSSRRVSN